MDIILQMAKAHLQNVAAKRDQLIAQRTELTKNIEEIEEFLEKGIQAVSVAAKVDNEKPNVGEDDEAAALAAGRDLGRMPPTFIPSGSTALERYSKRKDFS